MVHVILDSESALTSIGVGLLEQISSQLGGARLQLCENGPQTAKTATYTPVTVAHGTVPIAVCVRTLWGAVELPPTTYAVMPGRDNNMVLFEVATMKELGIDVYPLALDRLRPRAVPVQTGVESPSYLARGVWPYLYGRSRAPMRGRLLRVQRWSAGSIGGPKCPWTLRRTEVPKIVRQRIDSVPQAELKDPSADGAYRLRDTSVCRVDTFRPAWIQRGCSSGYRRRL